MSCNYTFHHIKILGLMIKDEQFNLNHSTKHVFTQKYIFVSLFMRIMKPSFTIPDKPQIIDSPCEPTFPGHFRSHSNQYMIYYKFGEIKHLNSPHGYGLNILVSKILINSVPLGPIKWPVTASFDSNICKVLKTGIKRK